MLTNYENFLKAANKAAGFIGAFVQHQLYLNHRNQFLSEGIKKEEKMLK